MTQNITTKTTAIAASRTRRLTTLLLAAGLAASAQAKDIFVDTNIIAAGDGSSWDNAFRFLQDGLRAAAPGDTVKVADGVYYPDRDSDNPDGSGDRTAFFSIPGSVSVEGSYAGFGALDPDARATAAPKTTVLCGDLNEDDAPGFGNRTDNAYHVVGVVDSPDPLIATLDGVRVSGGHADGSMLVDRIGGGVIVTESQLIAVCVELTDNFAADCGGGAYINSGSRMLIRDSRLGDNRSGDSGGGAYVEPMGEIEFNASNIEDNEALDGGGVYNAGALLLSIGNTIIGNRADRDGGGVFNDGGCVSVADALIEFNEADRDGGGLWTSDGEVELLDAFVGSNSSGQDGGGLWSSDSDVRIEDTLSEFNEADRDGGWYWSSDSDATIFRSVASENSAANGDSGAGGGMFVSGGTADLDGVTFTNNKTIAPFNGGGGLAAFDGALVTINGGLFDGNCAGFGGGMWVFGLNDGGGSVTVNGTDFTGNIADLNGGAADVFNSPITFSDTRWTDNMAVSNPGGAIQATVNSNVTITDSTATGNQAPNGAAFNFESGSSATLDNVDVLNNTAGVVNALQGNGTVDVTIRDSTFDGNVNGGIGIQDSLNVDIIGTTVSNTTGQPGVLLVAALGDAQGQNWTIDTSTFTDNLASGVITANFSRFATTTTVTASSFVDNFSPASGGGLQAVNANPDGEATLTITGTDFEGNSSAGDGGGLFSSDMITSVLQTTFDSNIADGDGGAWSGINTDVAMTMDEVIALENEASNSSGTGPGSAFVMRRGTESPATGTFTITSSSIIGGPGTNTRGLRADGVNVSLINSQVSAHTLTDGDAAGIMLTGGDRHEIINSTIAGNSTTGSAGGVLVTDAALDITGSILFANTDVLGGQDAQVMAEGTASVTADRSIVEGISSLPGTGSIGGDPRFIDVLGPDGVAFTGDEDLSLGAGSPAIDAGDNTALPIDLLLDLAGNARFFDDLGTPDTGVPGGAGGAIVVDMGAYEYADAPSCYADCDGDGVLDWFDFLCFQNAFDTGDASADCDGDGRFTVFDFLCFQNAFAVGCP